MASISRELITRIQEGGSLLDEELLAGIQFYRRLAADLKLLGAFYAPARTASMVQLQILEMFATNRGMEVAA